MLQKKLEELESELADVFRHQVDPAAPDPRREISFDDVKQRFSFLTKLLAAEVESKPQNSDQLREIGERLDQLKAAFHDWNKSRSCFFSNPEDTMSICSDCTHALLYDDDAVESGSEPEEEFAAIEKDERERREKYCRAFVCGMIVGAVMISMAAMMFMSLDHLIKYEASLLPPPT